MMFWKSPRSEDPPTSTEIHASDNADPEVFQECQTDIPSPQPTPFRETAWEPAHLQTCRSRNTLAASYSQVRSQVSNASFPPSTARAWVWSSESSMGPVSTVLDAWKAKKTPPKTKTLESSPAAGTTSWTRWTLNGAASAVNYLLQLKRTGYEDSDDDDDENQEVDDFENYSSDEEDLNVNDRILNQDLVLECLQALDKVLGDTSDQQEPVVVYRSAERNNGEHSWWHWCRQLDDSSLFPHLSKQQADLLLNVLLKSCQPGLVLHKDDNEVELLVLGGREASEDQRGLDVAVAQFRLKQVMQQTEQSIEEWSQQAEDCKNMAVAERRRGARSQALFALKKRHMFLQRIEQSRARLLNLEATSLGLGQAQSQDTCLQSLKESTIVLKAVQPKVEEVDEAMDDVQGELDRLEDLVPATTESVDEDELLRELQAMTISDEATEDRQDAETRPTESNRPSTNNKGSLLLQDLQNLVPESKTVPSKSSSSETNKKVLQASEPSTASPTSLRG